MARAAVLALGLLASTPYYGEGPDWIRAKYFGK